MTQPENKSNSLYNILGTALLFFGAILSYLHFAATAQQIATSPRPTARRPSVCYPPRA